jgi:hypothetical protein
MKTPQDVAIQSCGLDEASPALQDNLKGSLHGRKLSLEELNRILQEATPRDHELLREAFDYMEQQAQEAARNSKPWWRIIMQGRFRFMGPNPATFGVHRFYAGRNFLIINLKVCSFLWELP